MFVRRVGLILFFVLVFLAGFLLGNFFARGNVFRFTGYSVAMPSDKINTKDIIVYDDKVVIMLEKAAVNSYADSNSMSPFLGAGANGISIRPNSADEIEVGDVITFRKEQDLFVHRVVEKGRDEEGVYFITKGDENDLSDGKVRLEEVEYVLIAVVY